MIQTVHRIYIVNAKPKPTYSDEIVFIGFLTPVEQYTDGVGLVLKIRVSDEIRNPCPASLGHQFPIDLTFGDI